MAKEQGKPTNKDLSNSKDDLQADMRRFGYLLPTNEEELEAFESIFGKTQVMFPDHLKNPTFQKGNPSDLSNQPTKSLRGKRAYVANSNATEKSATKTGSKNDYFKKLVLAAEIAYQLHEEPTFGHIKFVKLLYLCNQVCDTRLTVNFGKYAAGPLDGKLIRVIDAEFKKRKWFTVTQSGYAYRYEPGENIEDYKVYYSRYYKSVLNQISALLELFRDKRSDFCEIVATIYFLWAEFNTKHKLVNEASLIKEFYDWDEKKGRFKESDIKDSIEWMREHRLTPA